MKSSSCKVKIIQAITLITFFLIILRFFYIQIIKHNELSTYAKKEFKRKTTEIMPRGNIYDINGNLLATSIVKWDLVIMKNEFNKNSSSTLAISIIARLLNMSEKEIQKKINSKNNYIKIAKMLEKDKYDQIENAIKENKIKGVILEPHQTRIFPLQIAKEVIGISNENQGLTQVELIYNKYLEGNIIIKEIVKDNKGNVIKVLNEISEKKPSDIYLTIDSSIQAIVEDKIKKYYDILKAKNIIVIVQDAKTGFISALASYPQDYVNLKPIEYVYEPGSTFKTIVLSAAFEENLIKENDLINCENGKWKINEKHTITDHEPLGVVTLIEAYKHSSNIGFGKVGLKLGIEKLYTYIKKFGFATKYTDFPGESKGIIKDFDKYRETDLITTSFGYSIAINPLQLINAYTAIANNGVLLKPQILYKVSNDEKTIAKPEIIREVISKQTADRVKEMMINVVEDGTGVNARIDGYYIGGKTGTANKLDLKTKKYIKGKNVTSFCGFITAKNPQYTILVIVDDSEKFKYGGQTSAPIFAEIAKQIISLKNIPIEREIDYSKINNKEKINIMN
jgi:cell division protein FtsI (penicillin-binding protein 3)